MTINRDEFLARFYISPEEFESSAVEWDTLIGIHDDFLDRRHEYEDAAHDIAERMRRLKSVHSIRLRAKDPSSLLNKIIRKYADRALTRENYRDHVTDLAGVRALHLYREDWPEIHEFITTKWPSAEQPKAYIRDGDDKTLYEERGCATAISDRGYRSVHYSVKTRPTVDEQIVEVQVRTLFAEGWGEIDHQVAYPNNTRDAIIEPYLALFNRACGFADEMATGLIKLRSQLDKRRSDYEKDAHEHESQKVELEAYIAELEAKYEISETEKQGLEKRIASLSESSRTQQRSYGEVRPAASISYFDSTLSPSIQIGDIAGKLCPRCGHRFNELLNPQGCPMCAMTTISTASISVIPSGLVNASECPYCKKGLGIMASVTGRCVHCNRPLGAE